MLKLKSDHFIQRSFRFDYEFVSLDESEGKQNLKICYRTRGPQKQEVSSFQDEVVMLSKVKDQNISCGVVMWIFQLLVVRHLRLVVVLLRNILSFRC